MVSFGLYGDSSEPTSQGMRHGTREEMVWVLGKVFEDWEPADMSWPINYGIHISIAAACITGPLFVHKFRSVLKMKAGRDRVVTMLPAVFGPAAVTGLAHQELITKDILLQETKCSVCLETRAMSLQVGFGGILPIALAYSGTYTFATWNNHRFPKGSTILSLTKNTMSKSFPLIVGVTIFQAVVAAGLVSLEVDSRDKVIKELDRRMAKEDDS